MCTCNSFNIFRKVEKILRSKNDSRPLLVQTPLATHCCEVFFCHHSGQNMNESSLKQLQTVMSLSDFVFGKLWEFLEFILLTDSLAVHSVYPLPKNSHVLPTEPLKLSASVLLIWTIRKFFRTTTMFIKLIITCLGRFYFHEVDNALSIHEIWIARFNRTLITEKWTSMAENMCEYLQKVLSITSICNNISSGVEHTFQT